MIKTFDQLIDLANTNLDQAEEAEFEDSTVYSNLAEGYVLIAIAQELRRMNDNRELAEALTEARRERMANLAAGVIFAE